MIDTTDAGDRRLEVTRGQDGRIVLASIGGGMPVAIRMTSAEAQAVIVALSDEIDEKDSEWPGGSVAAGATGYSAACSPFAGGVFQPMPKPRFNTGGWRLTGRVRLRTSWFGFAILEEEREHTDGSVTWARASRGRLLVVEEHELESR